MKGKEIARTVLSWRHGGGGRYAAIPLPLYAATVYVRVPEGVADAACTGYGKIQIAVGRPE
jgi:hypothetical protein